MKLQTAPVFICFPGFPLLMGKEKAGERIQGVETAPWTFGRMLG